MDLLIKKCMFSYNIVYGSDVKDRLKKKKVYAPLSVALCLKLYIMYSHTFDIILCL